MEGYGMTTDERFLEGIKKDPRLELIFVKTHIMTMLRQGIEPNEFIEKMVEDLKWRDE